MESRVQSRHGIICQWILDKHFPKKNIFGSKRWKDYASLDGNVIFSHLRICCPLLLFSISDRNSFLLLISLLVESVKNIAKIRLHLIGGMVREKSGGFQPSRFLCLLTRCVQGHFDKKDMEKFISDKDSA